MTKRNLPREDLTGKRFGRLIALSYVKSGKWLCQCDCGNQKIIQTGHLNSGITISCRCFSKENSSMIHKTHGYSYHGLYPIWNNMIKRCENPKNAKYSEYGGRGIKVCERWHTLDNFIQDMGERTSPIHTLDRIDNNGNYEAANCHWATPKEQANNRRKRRYKYKPKDEKENI